MPARQLEGAQVKRRLTSRLPGLAGFARRRVEHRQRSLRTASPLEMIGNTLSGVAVGFRDGRGDLLVQCASPPGWHLVICRLLQQRMTKPEPVLVFPV